MKTKRITKKKIIFLLFSKCFLFYTKSWLISILINMPFSPHKAMLFPNTGMLFPDNAMLS